jgi:hypothetical protein
MRSPLLHLAFAAVLALAVGTTAAAHHSFGATYDTAKEKEMKLEGKLVQFAYRNPHSFVHIEAPDKSGAMRRWAVEWGGTAQLATAGVKRDSLKVGDQVVVVVSPSRVPGELRALLVNLTRPSDGFSWGRRPGEQVE